VAGVSYSMAVIAVVGMVVAMKDELIVDNALLDSLLVGLGKGEVLTIAPAKYTAGPRVLIREASLQQSVKPFL
jgi:hypothetical protein